MIQEMNEVNEKDVRTKDNDGWILVEEQLPEESGTYIISILDGIRNMVSFAKWQKKYKKFDMVGKRSYWKVIAWRPLPMPYKPKEIKRE